MAIRLENWDLLLKGPSFVPLRAASPRLLGRQGSNKSRHPPPPTGHHWRDTPHMGHPQGPPHSTVPPPAHQAFKGPATPTGWNTPSSPSPGEGREERRGEGSNSITPSFSPLPPSPHTLQGHGGHLGPCIGPAGGSVASVGRACREGL